jgi:opacity protein-like surface antigen
MKKAILLALFTALFAAPAQAQNADSLSFPASWAGNWAGVLDIFNGKGKVQSVPMELLIQKIDSSTTGRYTFGLVYGSKDKDWRPYELVPVAPEKGLWQVDEKNGIAMESYLYGPKLLCWFVVQGNRILCTYEKTAEGMVFEVMAGSETAVSATGNTKQGEAQIPEVKTFPFSAFQRAILHKK